MLILRFQTQHRCLEHEVRPVYTTLSTFSYFFGHVGLLIFALLGLRVGRARSPIRSYMLAYVEVVSYSNMFQVCILLLNCYAFVSSFCLVSKTVHIYPIIFFSCPLQQRISFVLHCKGMDFLRHRPSQLLYKHNLSSWTAVTAYARSLLSVDGAWTSRVSWLWSMDLLWKLILEQGPPLLVDCGAWTSSVSWFWSKDLLC